MTSGYVPVENGRLYYETMGQGPCLVIIHAGFLDSRTWDEQFHLFAKNQRVVRYDVRGFGRSDVAESKFSDAKDLRDLLDHLGIKKTSIIGVSNGGRITFDFAVQYPEMIESLILVAPGIKGYQVSGAEEQKLWDEDEETDEATGSCGS